MHVAVITTLDKWHRHPPNNLNTIPMSVTLVQVRQTGILSREESSYKDSSGWWIDAGNTLLVKNVMIYILDARRST